MLHTSPAEYEQLAAAGQSLGLETILAIMQILDQTLSRLRYSTQARTLAELALVRIARLENLEELSDLIAGLRTGAPAAAGAKPPARLADAVKPAPSADAAAARKKKDEPAPAAEPAQNGEPLAAPLGELSSAAVALDHDTIEQVWRQALARLTGLLADNASLCESVTLVGPGRLAATFRAKYTSCKAFCERAPQRANLERALAEVTGSPVQVEFAVIADPPAAPVRERAVAERERLAETSQHPLVRRACELFEARVLRTDEPNA
jgi:DNA polymerase-3 subunit gamma/tau